MRRLPLLSTALVSLGLALSLAACGAPAPTASHVSIESDSGAISADVEFEGGAVRGNNTLLVKLSAADAHAVPVLSAVDAAMPAHDHHASANAIALEGDQYRVSGLDLFMSGRWVVALELSLEQQPDRASFSIDVP
jgi:hypothetical protein